jgi:3-methyladenine DNA glycosylase AlkD
MTPVELFNNLHSFFLENADPAIVEKYARYFKDGYPGYGLQKGLFEQKVDSIQAPPEVTLDLILKTAPLLLETGKYEETSALIRMTLKHHKQFSKETFLEVEKWFGLGITNWAHTDYICGDLMHLFFRKKIIQMDDISEWRKAKNKFQRRAVPVSLIKPMKVSSDFQPFFNFINPMMMDPEREVHQGLGWFLREAWKKQPEHTEAFLFKWKNSAARLIFQYATEKMTPEQKLRFRKEK